MRVRSNAVVAGFLVGFLAACGGSGPAASTPAASTAVGTTVPPATTVAAPVRIDVTMTDFFTIQPDPMTVPAGVPITFVIKNTGTLEHEFFLGDAAAQDAHEAEMAAHGGEHQEGPMGIVVAPGTTGELSVTLPAGSLIAGCHIPDHYGRGMKAAVKVID